MISSSGNKLLQFFKADFNHKKLVNSVDKGSYLFIKDGIISWHLNRHIEVNGLVNKTKFFLILMINMEINGQR